MLRNIIIIGFSIFSFNSFADSYYVKYDDLMKEITITENFKNTEDFLNRIEELKYVNGQFVNVLKFGNENTNLAGRNLGVFSAKKEGNLLLPFLK